MSEEGLLHDVAAELELAFDGIGNEDLNISPLPEPELFQEHARGSTRLARSSIDAIAPICTDIPPEEPAEFKQQTPTHPIPRLQAEFDESIMESLDPEGASPSLQVIGSAEDRRRHLLEAEDYHEHHSSRWRQKPGAKYHPLRKLVAQISYGIHLLHKRKAIEEAEVIRILQGHVDDVDSFVEDALADFELAHKDIAERVEHLMLPLEHSRTFNRMLCDRDFRESIIEGNELIERVIIRTSVAAKRTMEDVQEGLAATVDLLKYLRDLEVDWQENTADLMDVYDAMRGNAEGWTAEFRKLQGHSAELDKLMLRLGYVIDEVAKRCGIASRRKTPSGVTTRRSQHAAPEISPRVPKSILSTSSPLQSEKPLPPPPRRISTNPLSEASSFIMPRPPPVQTTHRPTLSETSSSPSVQTIDCLHRPPHLQTNGADRPSSSGGVPRRTVHFQRNPPTQSPLSCISSHSPSSTPVQRASGVTVASVTGNVGSPRSVSRPVAETPRTRPQLGTQPSDQPAGLGIAGLQDAHHHPSRVLAANRLPSTILQAPSFRPPPVRAPASDPVGHPGGVPHAKAPTSSGPKPRVSLSVFPSTADPRERKPRTASGSPVREAKTFPAERKNSELESKPAQPTPAPATPATLQSPSPLSPSPQLDDSGSPAVHRARPSADMRSPYTPDSSIYSPSISDIPALSPSNHATSDSLATMSSFTPQTPDDYLPLGGLQSHPVDPRDHMAAVRKSIITALPTFASKSGKIPTSSSTSQLPTYPSPTEDMDDSHTYGAESKRRAQVSKKPSLTAMRNLFGKKPAVRETRMGHGGLGGCVALA